MPGGTPVGPGWDPVRNHAPRRASRCLARRMEKVRLASPTTRASALGSMSSKRLSLTTQKRFDMSHLCHIKNGKTGELGQDRLEVRWEAVMFLFNVVNLNV